MAPEPQAPLAGRRVLITRPAGQSAGLAALIEQAGGEPVLFPAIEIAGPADPAKLDHLIAGLESFDLAIFISPTAVEQAFRRIPAWPQGLQTACVGQGSVRALEQAGRHHVIAPQGANDSEALLDLPQMHRLAGKRIVIFRGEGGRELLADTLRRRGALVEYAECYRRVRPPADAGSLLQQHAQRPLDAAVVTSREGLENLHGLLGAGWQSFLPVPLFVPHERIAKAAREMGFRHAIVTTAGDAGCFEAMRRLFMVKSGA